MYQNVVEIRILPNNKSTFPTEQDFHYFIENTFRERGGYYFPNLMMQCDRRTLVLFQYDGMIRAVGVLLDVVKESVKDEHGVEYGGYYRFDMHTVRYLSQPIDRDHIFSGIKMILGVLRSYWERITQEQV